MSVSRQELLGLALHYAEAYEGNLTLRQLYYRILANGHIESGQKSYTRLGQVVNKARLEGEFPLEWLIDRGRIARPGSASYSASAEDTIRQIDRELRNADHRVGRGSLFGQPTHLSVWVEKDALAGVFEEPCREWGVPWFVCKGYASTSALYQWLENTVNDVLAWSDAAQQDRDLEPPRQIVVLYFGDHDPDGFEIPRAAERTLEKIAAVKDWNRPWMPDIEFVRVALTMQQIEQYQPPSFGAKMTSTRYAGYVEEHATTGAWELDALAPPVLQQLIRDSIEYHVDDGVLEHVRDWSETQRQRFIEQVKRDPGRLTRSMLRKFEE